MVFFIQSCPFSFQYREGVPVQTHETPPHGLCLYESCRFPVAGLRLALEKSQGPSFRPACLACHVQDEDNPGVGIGGQGMTAGFLAIMTRNPGTTCPKLDSRVRGNDGLGDFLREHQFRVIRNLSIRLFHNLMSIMSEGIN